MKHNVYSGGTLDRANLARRDPAWVAARRADPNSLLVPVWRAKSLIRRDRDTMAGVQIPAARAPWLDACADGVYLLGIDGGVARFAVDLSALDDPEALLGRPDGEEFIELRHVGAVLPAADAALLALARGLCHWHQGNRFCSRCGAPTALREGGTVRRCSDPACGTDHYPRTDPAVIVLVSAGEHCLLGRQPQWPAGMFSTLAGFVEQGESLEEAVAREVMEETGVAVSRLRYHSSQPWPFPSSLMVGFLAETEGVAPPTVDRHELETAAWFTRAEIRDFPAQGYQLPRPDSLACRLVEAWLAGA